MLKRLFWIALGILIGILITKYQNELTTLVDTNKKHLHDLSDKIYSDINSYSSNSELKSAVAANMNYASSKLTPTENKNKTTRNTVKQTKQTTHIIHKEDQTTIVNSTEPEQNQIEISTTKTNKTNSNKWIRISDRKGASVQLQIASVKNERGCKYKYNCEQREQQDALIAGVVIASDNLKNKNKSTFDGIIQISDDHERPFIYLE